MGLDYNEFVKVDQQFYRPAEVDLLIGDTTKARAELGWEPTRTFRELVSEMVQNDLDRLSQNRRAGEIAGNLMKPDGQSAEELGQLYDEEYYRTGCGPVPYTRAEPQWLPFFGSVAEQLIRAFHPKRVLDAGCALGFLVEAFWDRGVEAWGIDVSPYAIAQVRRDMQPTARSHRWRKEYPGPTT